MDSYAPREATEFQTKPHQLFERGGDLTSAPSIAIEAVLV
jgi:hypothetical protein